MGRSKKQYNITEANFCNFKFFDESSSRNHDDVIIKGVWVYDTHLFVGSFVLSLFIILVLSFKY